MSEQKLTHWPDGTPLPEGVYITDDGRRWALNNEGRTLQNWLHFMVSKRFTPKVATERLQTEYRKYRAHQAAQRQKDAIARLRQGIADGTIPIVDPLDDGNYTEVVYIVPEDIVDAILGKEGE